MAQLVVYEPEAAVVRRIFEDYMAGHSTREIVRRLNLDHVPSYTQVNMGVAHDFFIVAPNKPTTLRFDVVNVFDKIYEIRDGSGIGVCTALFGIGSVKDGGCG